MCRKDAEDPQLGWREPEVLPSPDPRFQTPESARKRSGIGISLQCVARSQRELKGTDRVADVEAD